MDFILECLKAFVCIVIVLVIIAIFGGILGAVIMSIDWTIKNYGMGWGLAVLMVEGSVALACANKWG